MHSRPPAHPNVARLLDPQIQRGILHTLASLLSTQDEINEAYQETFVRLMVKIGELPADKPALLSYVRDKAQGRALDRVRRKMVRAGTVAATEVVENRAAPGARIDEACDQIEHQERKAFVEKALRDGLVTEKSIQMLEHAENEMTDA
jgi:DNA-directed RNA polymerase specialized sigma24 family protein